MTSQDDLVVARALPTAAAANGWLFPADLAHREPEVAPGFPDRLLPKDEEVVRKLAGRTLTGLYNGRPEWLIEAHRSLDGAVARRLWLTSRYLVC